MKKFICSIIVLLAAVILYSPNVRAQGVDTVRLSVKAGLIVVDSTDTKIDRNGRIVFFTEDQNIFTVLIDNYDEFIANPVIFLNFTVSRDNPVTITIGDPQTTGDKVKYYSVGTLDKKAPLPPASPPRIILSK